MQIFFFILVTVHILSGFFDGFKTLFTVVYLYKYLFFRYVFISMDILDQLLVSCHAHSLNLFVESFLKMVQKLLESSEPQMQIKATESVRKQCHCHTS